jgi:hypothetical protein
MRLSQNRVNAFNFSNKLSIESFHCKNFNAMSLMTQLTFKNWIDDSQVSILLHIVNYAYQQNAQIRYKILDNCFLRRQCKSHSAAIVD